MLKILDGYPDNVLAVEATGMVTRDDYEKVLIPATNERLKRTSPVRLLYVAGKDFKGYEVGAMWEDAKLGVHHWRDFSHVAIVSDVGWLRSAAVMFAPFFPGGVKLFNVGQLMAAKEWVSQAGEGDKRKNSA